MPENGKRFIIGISAYLLAKCILNLDLGGFAMGNIVMLAIQAGFAALLLFRVKYGNWIVGILTVLLAAYYLPGNLSGLPGTWLYLAEAAVDIGASVLLFVSPDVKAYFQENAS